MPAWASGEKAHTSRVFPLLTPGLILLEKISLWFLPHWLVVSESRSRVSYWVPFSALTAPKPCVLSYGWPGSDFSVQVNACALPSETQPSTGRGEANTRRNSTSGGEAPAVVRHISGGLFSFIHHLYCQGDLSHTCHFINCQNWFGFVLVSYCGYKLPQT